MRSKNKKKQFNWWDIWKKVRRKMVGCTWKKKKESDRIEKCAKREEKAIV